MYGTGTMYIWSLLYICEKFTVKKITWTMKMHCHFYEKQANIWNIKCLLKNEETGKESMSEWKQLKWIKKIHN